MNLHGEAKGSTIEDLITMICKAEIEGTNKYYELYYWAKTLGYDDVAEAILLNASEDGAHGGKYSVMLGNGPKTEEEFWKQLVGFYHAEANAENTLKQLIGNLNVTSESEKEMVKEIEKTAPEEIGHAQRLAKVFDKHGIDYKK